MLSIVYITCREFCHFEWFIQSLIHQSDADLRSKIQIIIVDGLLGDCEHIDGSDACIARKNYFANAIAREFEFVHVPPKPTKWQGRWRVTNINYFAAANTRNTGACYAKYPYIAFHDDLGCPTLTWLNSVTCAKKFNKIQCGAYSKVFDLVVENGNVVSKRDHDGGVDCRLKIYNQVASLCESSHFFGSSFCLPLDVFFEINGMNEMCDGCGAEDYDLGIRLRRQGYDIYYHKNMFIWETETIEESDRNRVCLRSDPKLDPNDPHSDLSHYLLNYSNNGPTVVNPEFSLRDYHDKIVNQKMNPDDVFLKPVDHIHFFTNRPVSQGL